MKPEYYPCYRILYPTGMKGVGLAVHDEPTREKAMEYLGAVLCYLQKHPEMIGEGPFVGVEARYFAAEGEKSQMLLRINPAPYDQTLRHDYR